MIYAQNKVTGLTDKRKPQSMMFMRDSGSDHVVSDGLLPKSPTLQFDWRYTCHHSKVLLSAAQNRDKSRHTGRPSWVFGKPQQIWNDLEARDNNGPPEPSSNDGRKASCVLEFYVSRRAQKVFAILHSVLFFPLKVIGEVPVASL
jgi:hypothetical protein